MRSRRRPVAVASSGLNPPPLWIRYSPATSLAERVALATARRGNSPGSWSANVDWGGRAMTEVEWLCCDDPLSLWRYLRTKMNPRRFQWLAVEWGLRNRSHFDEHDSSWLDQYSRWLQSDGHIPISPNGLKPSILSAFGSTPIRLVRSISARSGTPTIRCEPRPSPASPRAKCIFGSLRSRCERPFRTGAGRNARGPRKRPKRSTIPKSSIDSEPFSGSESAVNSASSSEMWLATPSALSSPIPLGSRPKSSPSRPPSTPTALSTACRSSPMRWRKPAA